MFARSAAMDTLQGQAIQKSNQQWGDHNTTTTTTTSFTTTTPTMSCAYVPKTSTSTSTLTLSTTTTSSPSSSTTTTTPTTTTATTTSSSSLTRRGTGLPLYRQPGRETLGIPVCKKKYKPFSFPVILQKQQVVTTANGQSTSTTSKLRYDVQVVRMYACHCHQQQRLQSMLQNGGKPRPGWEPFGQWSMKKAHELARKECIRLNKELQQQQDSRTVTKLPSTLDMDVDVVSLDETSTSSFSSSSATNTSSSSRLESKPSTTTSTTVVSQHSINLCGNGECAWKMKSSQDDIEEELQEMIVAKQQEQERQKCSKKRKTEKRLVMTSSESESDE